MNFLRNVFAVVALPAVLAAGYSFVGLFLRSISVKAGVQIPFWLGVFAYAFVQILLYRPLKTYIFGHELSHAIAGILSGAQIKKFNVNENSGSVVLTKNNLWITLSPYFFPIYTFAALVVYILLSCFINVVPFYGYFLFLIGFTISFHVALTIYVLTIEQPDLRIYGVLFSYVVIVAINTVVFSILFGIATPNIIELPELFFQVILNVYSVYEFIYNGVLEIWTAFQKTR
ncbi:MAG: hypothetical protein LBU55_02975 [Elusimicrobiota bacterium]|jgi:hypothetical protein|nr:hypothetical protein [Elusimicrobiota bacterium]